MESFILGDTMKMLLAATAAFALKYILGPKRTLKANVSGILAGVLCAYYGHDFVIENVSFFTEKDEAVVVIMLCLSGEHIIKGIIQANAQRAVAVIRALARIK